jgi:hypothetical protein
MRCYFQNGPVVVGLRDGFIVEFTSQSIHLISRQGHRTGTTRQADREESQHLPLLDQNVFRYDEETVFFDC